ncbi:MAG: ABC transporter permease [Deltaproteobacteria bacterium]|jgi:NitT/TauT family transport system permease protein|nr:ABC transporter permease [Deltaproteobacteria bacterium]
MIRLAINRQLKKIAKTVRSKTLRRGVISIAGFFIIWELCARFKVPVLGTVPSPTEVLRCLADQITEAYYWHSWGSSMVRILTGFAIAQLLGVPLGLLLGFSRKAREIIFPLIELMRPVPPLAWVPVSVIFWPSAEMSMIFVTFLGAFFTVVLNIVEGIAAIDERYLRAASSLGAGKSDIFWHVMLPASLPSVLVGMTVGMGITWCVVVAAEMIATNTGLGYLTWRGYVAGEFPMIVVGMLSIGLAGYLSSGLIRRIGLIFTPWLESR